MRIVSRMLVFQFPLAGSFRGIIRVACPMPRPICRSGYWFQVQGFSLSSWTKFSRPVNWRCLHYQDDLLYIVWPISIGDTYCAMWQDIWLRARRFLGARQRQGRKAGLLPLPSHNVAIIAAIFYTNKNSRSNESGLFFHKILILLVIKLVAGVGFEPTTFRLWAWRATGLLHPAII